jgi:hypothetical protein
MQPPPGSPLGQQLALQEQRVHELVKDLACAFTTASFSVIGSLPSPKAVAEFAVITARHIVSMLRAQQGGV